MPPHLIFAPVYNSRLAQFGINKPFALDRAELVLGELESRFGNKAAQYEEPQMLREEDILLVHTERYLESLRSVQTWIEIMELSEHDYDPTHAARPLPELFDSIKIKSGGTLLAARRALESGLCANLGGGYHHAFPDRGRGYCVIHDLAITIRRLRQDGLIKKVLVVDLDYHQGDGTALIFENDPDTFTLSVHAQEAWPELKRTSTLDVPFYQGEEHLYLEKTAAAVRQSLQSFAPDLVLYVAGSDPYEKDVLPGTVLMKLTLEQLRQRDRFVIGEFADRGIPLASVFAGGYGPDVWEVHYNATEYLLERCGVLIGSQSIH